MIQTMSKGLRTAILGGMLLCISGGISEARWPADSGAAGVSMQQWVQSSKEEQRAYLKGMITIIELERAWLGKEVASLSTSLVQGWHMGLSGVSVEQILEGLDSYIRENPKDKNKEVTDVVWLLYVQPKLSTDMRVELQKAFLYNHKRDLLN